MSHFAKIESDIVTKVIVAEQDFIDRLSGTWVETSYTGSIRKNYAGKGYTYDSVRDAFIPPKPFASWTLNESTCLWQAPVTYPDDGKDYDWNEETSSWDEDTTN
tara:strand:+ start:207 stop:518 length:312 start_codon:yes stop_codon:yes gene_type:complete